MRRILVLCATGLIFLSVAPSAQAAVIPLDPSFAGNGKLRLPPEVVTHIDDVQSSGGYIYAAGVDERSDPKSVVVLRFESNGALDVDYGSQGIFRRGLPGKPLKTAQIDVQPDGSSAVVFQSRSSVALVRLSSDGTPDRAFSGDGFRRWKVDSGRYVEPRVAVDKLGRVVVSVMTTSRSGADILIFRFDPSGILDPDFGSAGVRRINLYDVDWNDALALDRRNRLLIGTDNAGSDGRHPRSGALIRLRHNGAYDARFSDDGLARFGLAPRMTTWPIGIGIAAKGVITAGLTSGGTAFGAVRLRSDGTRINRYGQNGVFGVTCDCVATDADVRSGRVALTGYRGDRTTLAVRIDASGSALSQGWLDVFPAARDEVATAVSWSGSRLVLGGDAGRRGFVARTS